MTNNSPNFTSPLSVRRMFAPCKNTIKSEFLQHLPGKKKTIQAIVPIVHLFLSNTLNLNDVRSLASVTVAIFSMMFALHLQPLLTWFYKTVLWKASHGSKPFLRF